ncbi:MAG: RsmB/NOP family class I SAM-dependent RNA methyltransferase [Lactobacillus sp.]
MLPSAFRQKYDKLLGPKAPAFFAALAGNSKKAWRLNSLKAGQVQYDLTQPVAGIAGAYYGQVHASDPEWVSGRVYSQEPAAMFPAALSGVKPGLKVLDLCAAPGGKSTQLSELLADQGLLVANEISKKRVKALRENLERWGVTKAVVVNASPEQLATHLPQFFDTIVVDAPCSGEGMFRKDPAAMQYWSTDYVQLCQKRQRAILQQALTMLKPGGHLIYSTCTFSPEEDEQNVAWLLAQGLKIEHLNCPAAAQGQPAWADGQPELASCLRFWPQDGVGEGQFLARLQKPAGAEAVAPVSQKKRQGQSPRQYQRLTKQEETLVQKVLAAFQLPARFDLRKAIQREGHVSLPAANPELFKGLHVLANGVELGELKRKRFVPGQQLAQVLGRSKQEQVIALSEKAYQSFLHGNAFKVASDKRGYVLVSRRGFVFSFGKLGGDGVLKNFYPKGLRQ